MPDLLEQRRFNLPNKCFNTVRPNSTNELLDGCVHLRAYTKMHGLGPAYIFASWLSQRGIAHCSSLFFP
jgi:hypothetical protein